MRILLIMPDAHMHKLRIGPFVRSMREAPLTLTTLAALVPDFPGTEIKIVDGSVDPIPWANQPIWWGSASSPAARARHTLWPNISVNVVSPLCSVGFM